MTKGIHLESKEFHTCFDEMQVEGDRRRGVIQIILNALTQGSTDYTLLASPIINDNLLDLLAGYMTLEDWDHHYIMSDPHGRMIESVSCGDISPADFEHRYMEPNRVVMIRGLSEKWKVNETWIHTETGLIDVDYIKRNYGHDVVDVHMQEAFNMEGRKVVECLTVGEYCDWWTAHRENGGGSDQVRYIKDWTFPNRFPKASIYSCPDLFSDDWMNYSLNGKYRFVYLGVKGTSTKLHCDVLASYSWSCNITGMKEWYLLPPQYSHLLFSQFGELAPHFFADDSVFPGLRKARKHLVHVIQRSGETIFVPSGWYHTVQNLEDTLSINHNWINRHNIQWGWMRVAKELASVDNNSGGGASHKVSQMIADIRDLWFIAANKVSVDLKIVSDVSTHGLVVRERALSNILAARFVFQEILKLSSTEESFADTFDSNVLHRCLLALEQVKSQETLTVR
jgi:hypothetical protein